jgi:Family of unknown function (DUF5681)
VDAGWGQGRVEKLRQLIRRLRWLRRRSFGRPFKKGQSGNPSGRSKDKHTISQLAKAYTEEAIEKLAAIMRTGKTEQAQVRAAEALLDRGWGKAPQHVGGSETGEPMQIYLKNFVLPEGDNPPMGDVEWQASDEPAVRIR